MMFVVGFLVGAIIWLPLGAVLGYWLIVCLVASKAFNQER